MLSDTTFDDPTSQTNVSNEIQQTDETERTQTSFSRESRSLAELRDRARFVRNDVVQAHEEALRRLLDAEANEKLKMGLSSILLELAEEWGLGWSDIAKIVNVSVPAIRKWRNGGDISPSRLYGLARLAAFLKVLQDQNVVDPAAWLMTPAGDVVDPSVTKASIYAGGFAVQLLAYADGHIDLEKLLLLAAVPADRRRQTVAFAPAGDGSYTIVPLGS
jgi:hypothetical protein